ncbi:MAG: hypothetical protein ACK4MF_03060 [Hyphomicrobiaceae bacterium]
MRALGTFVLLTGGLSVMAYAYMPVASFNERHLARLVEIQSPTGRVAVPVALPQAPTDHVRSFSPSTPFFARSAARAASKDADPEPLPTAPSSQPWRAIVSSDGASRPAGSSGDSYVAQVALAREIQRELKRVGCYSGDADGDWKAASRRAMGTFLQRLNASLPTDAPDHVMLTLLQGRTDRVCGAPCTPGQSVGGDGQCLPGAVIAEAPAARPYRGATPPTRLNGEGHADMTTGSIVAGAAALGAARDRPTALPPQMRTATVETEDEPRVLKDTARQVARIAPDVPAEPLPGRMSVGAPQISAAAVLPGLRSGSKESTAAPAPPVGVIPRDAPQRSGNPAAQPVRDRAAQRTAGSERVQRVERRQAAHQPRPRKKLTVTDLMRQINGF